MTLRLTILFIFLSIVLTSCLVVDHTSVNEQDKCSVHNVRLKKKIVKRVFGRQLQSHIVNRELYPFAKYSPRGKFQPTWPSGRFAKIYVCDSCTLMDKKELKK